MYRRLDEFLRARQPPFATLTHHGAVTAQEQAAATHTPGRSMAKVVIVKERDGYVMAVLPAAFVLDLNRLKGLIGHGDVRLATIEEIGGIVPDCVPGAIPPFGALYGMRTFVDRRLVNLTHVTMPAGDVATAIRMRSQEFLRLAESRVGDFAVAEFLLAGALRDTGRRRRASSGLHR